MDEKDYCFTGYNKTRTENARELRRKMTEQEGKLWHMYLKKHIVKFYRQRTIDNYIVDFYCSKAKLVIEIDGNQHYTEEGLGKDRYRTRVLEKYGLKILRFSNAEIDENIYGVCQVIDDEIRKRMVQDFSATENEQ